MLNLGQGVGTSKHNCLCFCFIGLATCFDHCGPSSGHKNIYRGKLYRVRLFVLVHILNFQQNLVVMRFIRLQLYTGCAKIRYTVINYILYTYIWPTLYMYFKLNALCLCDITCNMYMYFNCNHFVSRTYH